MIKKKMHYRTKVYWVAVTKLKEILACFRSEKTTNLLLVTKRDITIVHVHCICNLCINEIREAYSVFILQVLIIQSSFMR